MWSVFKHGVLTKNTRYPLGLTAIRSFCVGKQKDPILVGQKDPTYCQRKVGFGSSFQYSVFYPFSNLEVHVCRQPSNFTFNNYSRKAK